MFKYSFLVLFAACYLTQVFSHTAPRQSSKDEVKKAFESMMAAIDKALTEAQSALDEALNKVNAEAATIEDKAKKEVASVTGPLKEKLDKYVQEAADLGLDVTNCETYVDQFAAIPNNTVDGIIGCITEQVSKAKGYCDDALANCKQIESDLAGIESQIDGCKGNALKQAKCYAKLIEEIAKDTSSAPQHIVEDVTKATTLVTEIFPILEQCETNQVKNVGTTAAKLVAEFALCAGLPSSM